VNRPLDVVLDRLPGAKNRGHYFLARCPSHEDQQASLSIAEGHDGRVLLKCFAGCRADHIVARLGLRMRDLFSRRAR
jgi:hypothetical protein